MVGYLRPVPHEQGSRSIQLTYSNTFQSIWEYKISFLRGRIDFSSLIGERCPVCGSLKCYRQITPYWRYATDLFPDFKKEQVPVARFLCRNRKKTFSLLPIQLIPYFQYTAQAVIGTLLLGCQWWQKGKCGFWNASREVDPESSVTPYLIALWLRSVIHGFRRTHPVLKRFYDLSAVRTANHPAWEELREYFTAFCLEPGGFWQRALHTLLCHYSLRPELFLFGTASQYRLC